ncbi:amidohydrolase family protein [Winogradskyella sp. SYSU M77433]|uniref:amidohydrolase family protein n=1 Tax=Winogradskyella sp. SYSU M77433 TaxID=3042722 RepID=UPI0024815863|nr:amidohydrolase family protein [Winogradskyella sp. SYSU M77433]MDH7914210.1 amidohydrolase family protein [Winogradskyella sp. SYSU M77433]
MQRIILLGLIALAMSCAKPKNYDLVFLNAQVFDGYEDKGLVNIAINNDTIAAITLEEITGDSIIDASDKYIIPGIVNAHVHANSVDDLKEGYPLGILTLLNMHTGLEDRESEWKKLSKDSLGFSTLYGSGHAATAPGGHPTQFSPDMETINDSLSPDTWIEHRLAKDVDYIKIVRTNASMFGDPVPPTLSYEQIGKLIDLAHQKNLKAVVHTSTLEGMLEIAKYKPDGFVHMPSRKDEYPLSDEFYKTIAANDIFIVTTAGINLKPIEEMLPPDMAKWIRENIMSADEHSKVVKKMHDNGILIVAGTDSQEYQMDFGKDYYLELEIYKNAGLSNLDILKIATGNAAKAFNLPIGELKVGSKADFVILKANPLENIDNIKKVDQVWKNGKTF